MINPHSLAGQKITALIESVVGVTTDDDIVKDVENLVNEVLSKANLTSEQKQKIEDADVTELRVYFVDLVSKNVDDKMLKQYQEFMQQQTNSQYQLKNISFAKFATLMTILAAFIKDDKATLADLVPVVRRIVESPNI